MLKKLELNGVLLTDEQIRDIVIISLLVAGGTVFGSKLAIRAKIIPNRFNDFMGEFFGSLMLLGVGGILVSRGSDLLES